VALYYGKVEVEQVGGGCFLRNNGVKFLTLRRANKIPFKLFEKRKP
jgi:hypothetical protein